MNLRDKHGKAFWIWYAVIALWAAACWGFFQLAYQYHFFYQEQNQLFLLSAEYVRSYFNKPAWAACLTGDFLTQFYYYLYLGPAILTAALLTVGDLTRRAMQRAGAWSHLAFATATVLMTAEAIMCFRVEYRLQSVVALAGGMAAYLVSSLLHRTRWWAAFITIAAGSILTWWAFGYGLWAYWAMLAVEMACAALKKNFSKRMAAYPVAMLAALAAILPATKHYCMTAGKALAYPGMGKLGAPDFVLEKDLAVDNEYHFGNYHKVEQIVESSSFTTEQMLFFYNLVQAQKGELPDKLLNHVPNQLGTFYAIGPNTPRLVINNMNELYWALGDMTFTERAAMMCNVFAGQNRNVRMIKRLAECNLVSGDTLAANKYLRLLSQTLAYSGWAKRMAGGDPKAMRYIIDKRQNTNNADTIRISDNLHMVMMELLDSNPGNTTALDYILCSDLLLKDITNFKRDYDRYCYDKGRERTKPIYQQALMIYLAGTNASEEEWTKYIHDNNQMKRFAQYNKQRGNPQFKDTYWYYFDTAQTPKP